MSLICATICPPAAWLSTDTRVLDVEGRPQPMGVQDPLFFRNHHLVVVPGDQIVFSAGPAGERVHGTLAVVEVLKPTISSPGEVRTHVLSRTGLAA